ncbi:HipA family kinase [Streptomyces sp.]|uniref:HipA family kinase n=1 Tax=Streptomyces sp. TaxID=1931 RepID=UPI002F3F629F
MLREVTGIRYVTPLREGGSVPGVVEADDLGTYVVKFIGAAQGRKALVAEVISGELGRRLGLRVPELVRFDFDPVIGLGEPDQEIQDLLKASGGLNLGMDFLPGSLGFDPLVFPVDTAEASRIVWFDALIGNVDRSWRNPNMLVWHRNWWLIDHGASLIWHHNWKSAAAASAKPYDAAGHALARFSPDPAVAAAELAPLVTDGLLAEVTGLVPDEWLVDEPGFDAPDDVRRAYRELLGARAADIHRRITLAPRQEAKQPPPPWLRTWVEGKNTQQKSASGGSAVSSGTEGASGEGKNAR